MEKISWFDNVMGLIIVLLLSGIIVWVFLTKVEHANRTQQCVNGYMYRVNPQGVMFPISDGKEFVACE